MQVQSRKRPHVEAFDGHDCSNFKIPTNVIKLKKLEYFKLTVTFFAYPTIATCENIIYSHKLLIILWVPNVYIIYISTI